MLTDAQKDNETIYVALYDDLVLFLSEYEVNKVYILQNTTKYTSHLYKSLVQLYDGEFTTLQLSFVKFQHSCACCLLVF